MYLITDKCKCEINEQYLIIDGDFTQYSNGVKSPCSKKISIKRSDVLRIGSEKIFSKGALRNIMLICFLSIPIRLLLYGIGNFFVRRLNNSYTFLDFMGNILMSHILFLVIFTLAIITYLMSFRKVLEINTLSGCFFLSIKNTQKEDIIKFQRKLYK